MGLFVGGTLLVLVVVLGGCERSKLPPAPTVVMTSQAVSTPGTGTPTVGVGQTVIAADATATPAPGATQTPVPTLTATTSAPEATATPGPTATPEPGATATPAPAEGIEFEYVVQTGDSLWGLALRFGTTVQDIKTRNNLTSDIIYKGQELIIPGASEGDGTTVTHVVQRGENLFRISLKYGTTVQAIAAANGIVNPAFVYAGDELIIPQGSTTQPGSGVRYHVVQSGESLWSIALRYNTTPWKIAAANGISNINWIYAGRTLRIP
jgi:LysM repeat protein